MWVSVTRGFIYNGTHLKVGQLFRLQGHPNDGLLLKHGHVIALDPQPKSKAGLAEYPVCEHCGARFLAEWQRNKCREAHAIGQPQSARPTYVIDERNAAGRRAAHKLRLAQAVNPGA